MRRTGFPEVVMAEGKEPEEVEKALEKLVKVDGIGIASRVDENTVESIDTSWAHETEYDPVGRVLVVKDERYKPPYPDARLAVVTAGTSDEPYARECAKIAEALGADVLLERDAGVAGLHRLLTSLRRMERHDPHAVVAVAGMDGTMPVVLASLTDIPVIGLPTPTGYGIGGSGEAALKGMLQSCVPGLLVVNVGNGVGAAAAALRIAKAATTKRKNM